uniref:Tuftelin 1 n=1 Tax=Rhinolophus ferrumequinum TaxID=59479 RepID=A0A671EWE0_RHIFE
CILLWLKVGLSLPELTSGWWEVLCQVTEEHTVLRDWPRSPGPLFAQTSSHVINNQALGWKELQHTLLPLLIYALSNLVRIPGVVLEKPNGFSESPSTLYSSLPEVDTCVNEDAESLRKTVRDLLAKLREADWQHQSDRVAFEVTLSQYQREAEQSHVALQRAEDRAEQKEMEVGELQRRLSGMEMEHQALLAKVREGEAALEELRSKNADCRAEQEKAASLEKEVAGLREKIHHLDDMLKSQQRKVRQMIEQLQNSKAVIQTKDTTIQELKEKIAFLEAENLEMHDRMEHLIEKQISHSNFSTQTWAKTENLGSVRIAKPPSPKPMPLIRVVET